MTARIVIATPTYGDPNSAVVSYAYHRAVRRFEKEGAHVIGDASIVFSEDVGRARSRAVWYALQRTGWTHILWWDADVAIQDHGIVERMLATGYDVVGAPYPRKRPGDPSIPYVPTEEFRRTGEARVDSKTCLEVNALGFGFVLTSRECLERMVEEYAGEWWTDVRGHSEPHEVVAIFKQIHTDPVTLPDGTRFREWLTEDYSFCKRWRDIGGKVHMYVGQGTPLGHVGGHVYTAGSEHLGNF